MGLRCDISLIEQYNISNNNIIFNNFRMLLFLGVFKRNGSCVKPVLIEATRDTKCGLLTLVVS